MKGTSLMDMGTIVPIVLALLLFFGSVVSAVNTVNKKNRKIDLVFSLVNVVDTLTQTGVVEENSLEQAVELLRNTLPASFYVCITDVNDDNYTQCTLKASKENGTGEKRDPDYVINHLNTDYLAFTFPVSYQVEKDGVPYNEVNKMLVIVWQGA